MWLSSPPADVPTQAPRLGDRGVYPQRYSYRTFGNFRFLNGFGKPLNRRDEIGFIESKSFKLQVKSASVTLFSRFMILNWNIQLFYFKREVNSSPILKPQAYIWIMGYQIYRLTIPRRIHHPKQLFQKAKISYAN